jgi:hypothetical protein
MKWAIKDYMHLLWLYRLNDIDSNLKGEKNMSEKKDMGMFIIQMPLKGNNLSDLTKMLPNDSYSVVIPKNFDGTEVIQLFIDVTQMVVPSVVTYLIATRKKSSIIVKYNDEKVSAEIQATLNNRMLKKSQLYEYLEQLLKMISEQAKE